jgi:hypothetical protein
MRISYLLFSFSIFTSFCFDGKGYFCDFDLYDKPPYDRKGSFFCDMNLGLKSSGYYAVDSFCNVILDHKSTELKHTIYYENNNPKSEGLLSFVHKGDNVLDVEYKIVDHRVVDCNYVTIFLKLFEVKKLSSDLLTFLKSMIVRNRGLKNCKILFFFNSG